ncbi:MULTISPECIES: hypothetical protein [Nitrosomonas]|uniref:Uncharacterized protein n=1 Tax=Nitrosomonas communis TaxID=44574 RepID=A0A0F7KH55_9PROT|nr:MULTISPECIES: hypothetical protein [Nitrosomonas]AKH38453.1 hypothetical protein AAW31_12670 [Nitrosomonas communis]UVS60484.1 hypothetical protein NX761_13340 [Nitrosomonas sp. PLL12]
MNYIFNDEGFGINTFIPERPDVEGELLAIMEAKAEELVRPTGEKQRNYERVNMLDSYRESRIS